MKADTDPRFFMILRRVERDKKLYLTYFQSNIRWENLFIYILLICFIYWKINRTSFSNLFSHHFREAHRSMERRRLSTGNGWKICWWKRVMKLHFMSVVKQYPCLFSYTCTAENSETLLMLTSAQCFKLSSRFCLKMIIAGWVQYNTVRTVGETTQNKTTQADR